LIGWGRSCNVFGVGSSWDVELIWQLVSYINKTCFQLIKRSGLFASWLNQLKISKWMVVLFKLRRIWVVVDFVGWQNLMSEFESNEVLLISRPRLRFNCEFLLIRTRDADVVVLEYSFGCCFSSWRCCCCDVVGLPLLFLLLPVWRDISLEWSPWPILEILWSVFCCWPKANNVMNSFCPWD
jgi:hypothetical protein